MGSPAAAIEQEQAEVLREACTRNTPAELHLKQGDTGLTTARVRLLGWDDDLIYVDRPQRVGESIQLQARQQVTVHLAMGGTRYSFRTRVRRAFCLVRLNAKQRVPGAALDVPAEVHQQQRRADFRLSLAGRDRVIVSMHQGRTEDGGSAPVDAPHFPGWLAQISPGALGLVADRSVAGAWKTGVRFFVSFHLPTVETEFCVLAEFRYSRRICDGLFVLGGFRFAPWPAAQPVQYQRSVTRFIASEQRRQLRRGR
ncbi:MAG: flagellar brake protein [bacterium]|nr:flagellar brake protein [bacterium]